MGGYFSSLLRHTGHSVISKTYSNTPVPAHGTGNFADINSPNFGEIIGLELRDSKRETIVSEEMLPGASIFADKHSAERTTDKTLSYVYNTGEVQSDYAQESLHISSYKDKYRDKESITWKEEISEPEDPYYKPSEILETEKDSQRAVAESYSPKFLQSSVSHRDEEPITWKEKEVSNNAKSVNIPSLANESQKIPGKESTEEFNHSPISRTLDPAVLENHKSDHSLTLEPDNSVRQSRRFSETSLEDQKTGQKPLDTTPLVTGLKQSDIRSAYNIFSHAISSAQPESLILSNSRSRSVNEKSDTASLFQGIYGENSQKISEKKVPAKETPKLFSSQDEVPVQSLNSKGRARDEHRNMRETLSLSIGSISITVEEPKETVPPRIIQVFESPAQDETSPRLNRHYIRTR
jgi:hypothetical protein